jgi:hypothetical protein
MSLTLEELSPQFMLAQAVSPATPARSAHPGPGPLRATRFGARLAACASVAPRGDAAARAPARGGGLCWGLPWSATSRTLLAP